MCVALPIDISEEETPNWCWIPKVYSGRLGDLAGSRWNVLGHGDLEIPGLPPHESLGGGGLYAIGTTWAELGIPLERSDNCHNRTIPISDAAGHFVATVDSEGGKTTRDESHVPSPTLSEIRYLPGRLHSRLGYECPFGEA